MNGESSLIHFSNPFLVYSGKENDKIKKTLTLSKFVPIRKTKFNKKTEIIKWIEDLEHNSTIEELLNTVITPVKFEEKGNIWLQTPVSFPATNRDVITLKDQLHEKLKMFNAKKYGICFIREEFYFQCFDEIIRQVIINFKKRGLLLSLIRDYFKDTLLFYKNIYISSCCFGIKKEIKAEKKKKLLKYDINDLDLKIIALKKRVALLKEKIKMKKKINEQESKENEINHNKIIKGLQEKKILLKEDLEGYLGLTKKY